MGLYRPSFEAFWGPKISATFKKEKFLNQPGSLCRLIKLVASKHTRTQIFLDSDQLEDLDLIFDTIRCKTHSVVVVLTPQVLTRMWCAGEIVTAFKNKILTVPLLCDGYTNPDVELLDHLEEIWTGQQRQILSLHGISLEDVRSAYVWLDTWLGKFWKTVKQGV